MNAKEIIENTKKELIKYIVALVKSISNKLGIDFEEEGAYVEDFPCGIRIQIPVDDSYLDVYDDCYEPREVTGVYYSEGDEPFVRTDKGDELYLKNLSVEELGVILEVLGMTDDDTFDGENEEIFKDINGVRIEVSDEVHWDDEAGYDENGNPITFTIVDEDGAGYFNLAYGDEDENPERWAYYTELEIV